MRDPGGWRVPESGRRLVPKPDPIRYVISLNLHRRHLTESQRAMDVVREYAEAMADGATFPPVTVFHAGSAYWLADGWHRIMAHEALGLVEIDADVREGDRREAILHSVGANASHGYRRTNADKRRAVMKLLADAEWAGWSDREISRRCAVGADMVGRLRPDTVAQRQYEPRQFVHPKTGNVTTMNTAAIGRREDSPVFDNTPAGRDERPPVVQYDHAAAEIRNTAIDAIKALARAQPAKKRQQGGARWAFTGQNTAQPWADWPSIWGIPA